MNFLAVTWNIKSGANSVTWSFKLFQIKGIDVKIHLTFVLILLWVAYDWGTSGGAGIRGAAFGLVATILLFACITLHEIAHSLVALRFGIRVHDILLLPIGGVSQIEDMPDKPSQELAIAVAGPVVSFAIAAVLFGVLYLAGRPSSISLDLAQFSISPSWTGMLTYLAAANLLLGLFNILPAFPMDGGRILRALLAMRLDYAKATTIAASIGQALAVAFGLLGFISGYYLLIFVAIFVWLGAGQEGGQVQVRGILRDVIVEQAMTRGPLSLLVDDTLSRAIDLTLNSEQADFPVVDVDNGRVVGMLTRDDILRGVRTRGEAATIADTMRTTFPTAKPDESLYALQRRVLDEGGQALPVLDASGRLVGLLTAMDINEAFWLLSARNEAKRTPTSTAP
ncbi:MAG TPA: site-2 protease family protein [Chloroflexota bacterium]|nr:site-2 protease family protein [Chloroflexota bacterium]